MSRRPRNTPGGIVYHVLNRAVARLALFEKGDDYAAFERVLAEAMEKHPTRLLSYQVMPNHWHMVVWPRKDGELTEFVRWLTHTHVMRWHAHYHTSGTGHLYQGRFKSFPVQTDEHFYTLVRYVERSALRANLVKRAQDWRWSSLWRRVHGEPPSEKGTGLDSAIRSKSGRTPNAAESSSVPFPTLHRWPLPEPDDWLRRVNRAQSEAEVTALRECVRRGSPFGTSQWQTRTARRLGLEWTLRPRGRPRKNRKN